MPIQVTSWTGTCGECGQEWYATNPAFDLYCPMCHTRVMKLSRSARLINAAGPALAVALFSGLTFLGLTLMFGGFIVPLGIEVTLIATVWTWVWSYRSVRSHRTLARFKGLRRDVSKT